MSKAVGYISKRLSLRWLPDEASEPTDTIVLTGARTGVFLDARFFKDSNELDWGIAGYRSVDPEIPNKIHFRHDIDSRTTDPATDSGTNTTLPDGTTLEVGEMLNPTTGKITPFEEIWEDVEESDGKTVLFIRNQAGNRWQGRVGGWQIGLGREKDGTFWAWQAVVDSSGQWAIKHRTDGEGRKVDWLPEYEEVGHWKEGDEVEWNGDRWVVLEKGV